MKQTVTLSFALDTIPAANIGADPNAFFEDIQKQGVPKIVKTSSGAHIMVMPKDLIEPFEDSDLSLVAVGALRYSMGRMTYMPGVVSTFIRRHMKLWNENTLKLFVRDITEHLSDYGEHEPYPETWYSLKHALEARLKELEEEKT